jgi:agmatinase
MSEFELAKGKLFVASEDSNEFVGDSLNIIGFCYDGSTSFRPGTRFGPDAIRDVAIGMEDYSPYQDDDLNNYSIYDLGNLSFHPSRRDLSHEHFEELVKNKNLKKENIKILTLGGEHSISFTPVKKYLADYDNLAVLHLDAHTDLRDGYLGDHHSHASVIRRIYDLFGPKHELIQYGIRSGLKEEFTFMKEKKTLKTSLEEICASLEAIPADRPIYMTLDLDFFDPAYMPGTGTPEAGGETFHNFMKLIKILRRKNFVGADIVELAPHIDPTGNSSCFAAKVCRETMLAIMGK